MTAAKSYRFGSFVLDVRSACLRQDDAPLPLRPKSFDLLLYLVRNRGRLITKNELFDNLWGNVVVTDNSLVQCIKEIRQALGDDGKIIVETVARRGYIFKPSVVECGEDTPAPGAPGVEPGRSLVQATPVGASSGVRLWWAGRRSPLRS